MRVESILEKIVPAKYYPRVERMYLKRRGIRYWGWKHTCPCCNGHFRTFVPWGTKPVQIACPRCYSVARYRLLYLYLRNKTGFFRDNLKVLDIAPTHYFQEMCQNLPNIDYFSADISSPLAMLRMNLTAIALTKNQFDCIICYHVLEHIMDDQKAMAELFRVLKPGGWAILQTPVDHSRDTTYEDPTITDPDERERAFNQCDHVRIYGRDYKDRLERAGFTVTVDDYLEDLGEAAIQRYVLMSDEKIYLCTKSDCTVAVSLSS